MSEMMPGGGYRLPERSRASRSIPKASKGHFNGHLVAGDGPGRIFRTESDLERRGLTVLLMRADIADVVEQPPAVSYVDQVGKRRAHFFDFLATRTDGVRLAIAVKPWDVALKHDFVATLSLIARQLPPGFADRIQLITERHLDEVDEHNAKLFLRVRRPDPEADAAAAAAV